MERCGMNYEGLNRVCVASLIKQTAGSLFILPFSYFIFQKEPRVNTLYCHWIGAFLLDHVSDARAVLAFITREAGRAR